MNVLKDIEKEYFKTMLSEGRVMVVAVHFNTNSKVSGYGWNGYRVFIHDRDDLKELQIEDCGFDPTKGFYKCNTKTKERGYFVLLQVAMYLGLEASDVKYWRLIEGGHKTEVLATQ